MNAFRPHVFYLYELKFKDTDSFTNYYIMNDSSDDGSFQISDILNYKELLSNQDVIKRNKSYYYKSLNSYAKYVSHQELTNLSRSDKIDIRLEYFRQVKARYTDWFLRNNVKISQQNELEVIAIENNIELEGINLELCNERMISTIRILNSNSDSIFTTAELLIKTDSMLDTVTSYTKISEVFKINRKLFKTFVRTLRKGIYQIRKN